MAKRRYGVYLRSVTYFAAGRATISIGCHPQDSHRTIVRPCPPLSPRVAFPMRQCRIRVLPSATDNRETALLPLDVQPLFADHPHHPIGKQGTFSRNRMVHVVGCSAPCDGADKVGGSMWVSALDCFAGQPCAAEQRGVALVGSASQRRIIAPLLTAAIAYLGNSSRSLQHSRKSISSAFPRSQARHCLGSLSILSPW